MIAPKSQAVAVALSQNQNRNQNSTDLLEIPALRNQTILAPRMQVLKTHTEVLLMREQLARAKERRVWLKVKPFQSQAAHWPSLKLNLEQRTRLAQTKADLLRIQSLVREKRQRDLEEVALVLGPVARLVKTQRRNQEAARILLCEESAR